MKNTSNILIIEDNLSFAIELEMSLSKWGFDKVKNINNSEDALEYILTKMPDLILMDINIKGNLNGVEVAQKVAGLDIPIIYMTGQREEKFYENAKFTNAVSYLVKPFDELTLRGAIEFALPKKEIVEFEKPQEMADYFFIRKRNALIRIDISDIDFINAEANYCDIVCGDLKNTVKISLKRLIPQLNDPDLFQIHKAYVVRLKSIDEIILAQSEVRINQQRIPIGRTYRKELLDRMKVI